MRLLIIFFVFLQSASTANRLFIIEKQEEKAKNRWSLSEWLDQRDRIRMMDLWLAMHSPSPYEFFVSAEYQTGHITDLSNYTAWKLALAAYATIFGLEVQHEPSTLATRTSGLFRLRVFGFHVQSTNLTLHGGFQRETRSGVGYWNPLAGISFTLYFGKYFGLEALYQHIFPYSSHGLATSGDRFEGGAFIDYNFLRFYADYLAEGEAGTPANSRRGILLGLKAFF